MHHPSAIEASPHVIENPLPINQGEERPTLFDAALISSKSWISYSLSPLISMM